VRTRWTPVDIYTLALALTAGLSLLLIAIVLSLHADPPPTIRTSSTHTVQETP